MSVKPAVAHVVIFPLAQHAHREFLHRGIRPVVRHRLDDREARSAMGTVGERIAIAAIARLENLHHTVRAGRDIGQNERRIGPAGLAVQHRKFRVADGVEKRKFEALDDRLRWLFALDTNEKLPQRCARALKLNGDTLR